MSRPRFEEAFETFAAAVAERRDLFPANTIIVRDLRGILRVILDDRTALPDRAAITAFAGDIHRRLGSWSPGPEALILFVSELFDPDQLLHSPELVQFREGWPPLLDRLVTGADWLRAPDPASTRRHPPRATFFGIKGGVGRSTAVTVIARELAAMGRRVLVVDLDLESPGVSHMLLPGERLPEFGLLDGYVELGVAPELDRESLIGMYARSPVADRLDGEVLVAPPRGRVAGDYLAKLSRAYVDGGHPGRGFADRTRSLLFALEAEISPDVVLLDSRAGLHDVAAAAVTRLDARCSFMFAGASAQTWQDYGLLFEGWNRRGLAREFRDRLQVVAAQVPELGGDAYLERLTSEAHRVFAANLYDEETAEDLDDFGAFNFDRGDDEAPHRPVPVRWQRVFFDWEVSSGSWPDPASIQLSFGPLLEAVRHLVLEEP